jgi:hypothetical protein
MSTAIRDNWVRAVWRMSVTLALLLGFLVPAWSAPTVLAQGTLPETASAAPAGTALFHVFDLDRDGGQWQQTETLLERVGLPNALEHWEAAMVEAGAMKGDFTEADLDALLGGELALVVTPLAVERAVEHHERHKQHSDDAATPMAHAWDEPLGVTAVLLPGDPDASWNYVERQVADLATKLDVPIEEVTHGGGELLWVEMPDWRERLIERLEGAMGDADLEAALAILMGATGIDGAPADLMGEAGMDGRPGFAAGRAGDFIIAGVTQADVTEIIDVVDGTTDSLAESPEAQQVAAELPAETLSFTYLNGEAILDAVGERTLQKLQAMMSPAEQAVWQSHSGMAVSAVEPGFRIDAMTVPGEGGSLGSAAIANDPAIAAAAERVPADTFVYQAGVVPEDAFTGAAYMLALAVNGEMAGEESQGGMNQLPSEEEMEEEIARATAKLGFDPRSELFDLLGDEFIAFSLLPTFEMMNGFAFDAAAAVTTSDPDTLAETMLKLAAYIERAGLGADVDVRDVDGNTIYVVSDPQMAVGPTLEFGVVGDQVVVGTGNGIEQLVTEPTTSLADDPQYQTVMELLPSEYYQVAYVNIGQLFAVGELVDVLAETVGVMEESPAAEAAVATPGPAASSPANIRALAAVSYQRGEAAGSSAILYIADSQS